MRRLILTLFVFCTLTSSSFAQFYSNQYRPHNQNWQELKTEHFRIIYPAESKAYAFRSARILEQQYESVQNLTGGNLTNFSVVLNAENDRSNGFVTPLNFRSEVEIPPLKGKAMNPVSGDWLELVLPHELVHALHMSVNPNSITSLIGLFSPDLRRSVHTAAPLGLFEGIAVEYESHGVFNGAGRGNYPYFSNRFNSNFMSDQRWSMGQLVHISSRTLPYDRHYVGSYEFTHWLQNQYGEDTFKDAIAFHYKYPILGFGFALRKTTGYWPRSLYRNFTDDLNKREENRLSDIDFSHNEVKTLSFDQLNGIQMRRPQWIDDNQLLFHGSYYNSPTGFYTFDLSSKRLDLLLEHRSVEDYRFSYKRDLNQLFFADYQSSRRFDNTFTANIYQYDLTSNKLNQIKPGNRLFAPDPGNIFLALQTYGSSNRIVSLNREDDSITTIVEPDPLSTFIEIQQHPQDDELIAVIMRRGSQQGLWITDISGLSTLQDSNPDVLFADGSVIDLDWHPSDNRILFTSDHTGVMNVYEYDLEQQLVRQITGSVYNAFEASWSPDGERIAYIYQQNSEFLPAILENESFLNRLVFEEIWTPGENLLLEMERPMLDSDNFPDETTWETSRYRATPSWLKPRTVIPYFNEIIDGTYEIGAQLHSTDPLGLHTYAMRATGVQNRFWYDIDYQYSGYHPGFGINVFNQPDYFFIRDTDDSLETPQRFLLQERGIGLYIPFSYTFRNNSRLTSLHFTPRYSISQARFFSLSNSSDALTNFGSFQTLSISAVFNFRIRQFARDFQPNAGWVLFGQAGRDINNYDFNFEFNELDYANSFGDRKGLRLGLYTFLSPLSKWNQSLRLGFQVVTQSTLPKYNTQNIISDAFHGTVFPFANNIGYFNTRYTIPLTYPDDGGFLIPVYLSNLYLVLFSHTVGDLNIESVPDIMNTSRTALGAGIRTNIRLSNLNINLGIGFGYEPSRNQWSLLVGQF
jgi:hypothetical protein